MFTVSSFNFIDFQDLSARISRRKLVGAVVSLEQMEQTDSVFVENLHLGTTTDQLTLYFESQAGGSHMVKEVTMLSEGAAKVSFVNYDCKFCITGLYITHFLWSFSMCFKMSLSFFYQLWALS